MDTANVDYMSQTPSGQVEEMMNVPTMVERRSLESTFQEVSDEMDDKATEVADEVIRVLKEDSIKTRDAVMKEVNDLKTKFDATIDALARRSDFSRLVDEVGQLREGMEVMLKGQTEPFLQLFLI